MRAPSTRSETTRARSTKWATPGLRNGSAPVAPTMNYLGGYTRGFDTATYGPGYSCPAGTPTAAECTAALPEMHPGILGRLPRDEPGRAS
jgi:hypothetical protein